MTDQFAEAMINNMSPAEKLRYDIPLNPTEIEECLVEENQITDLKGQLSDKDDEISELNIKIEELESRLTSIFKIAQDD
jgi:hypothetical protein